MTERRRRSMLYTPADDRSMMEKAAASDADAVIFDLEDAIPDEAVPAARDRIAEVVADVDFGDAEVCVRVNGLHTDRWLGDVLAACEAGVDAIALPMVETPDHLAVVDAVAGQAAAARSAAADRPAASDGSAGEAGGAPAADQPEIVAAIETPRGLFAAPEIAERGAAIDSVTGLGFGLGDYTRAIGATGQPERVHEFASHVTVAAAAMGGLDPLATVYQEFRDLDGLRETAEAAREIGYVGQKAIHPAQVPVLNEVFTPTEAEVERARRFVEAFADSPRDSIVVDGVFLDTAIVEQYETVLARAEEVSR